MDDTATLRHRTAPSIIRHRPMWGKAAPNHIRHTENCVVICISVSHGLSWAYSSMITHTSVPLCTMCVTSRAASSAEFEHRNNPQEPEPRAERTDAQAPRWQQFGDPKSHGVAKVHLQNNSFPDAPHKECPVCPQDNLASMPRPPGEDFLVLI